MTEPLNLRLTTAEPIVDQAGRPNPTGFLRKWQELVELAQVSDPRIVQAQNVVSSTYGDKVSVAAKRKDLGKFVRNLTVGNSYETIAEFQGATANETYLTTNLIVTGKLTLSP